MAFNGLFTSNYRAITIFRILSLTVSIFLFNYLLIKTGYIMLTVLAALLIVTQIISLIHLTEKTNRDLARFLLSIRYDDSSQAFVSSGLGSSFTELKNAFREVMSKLQESRIEKDSHTHYLQTIVQHIGIGLISFRSDGEIDLINNTAKKALGAVSIRNISDLRPIYPEFVDAMKEIKSGSKALVKVERMGETLNLSLRATVVRLTDDQYKVVSIQNIHDELEEREMEAWRKLIRVLTHEIMNSMTPISSMASTLIDLLRGGEEDEGFARDKLDPEELEDVAAALTTIRNRSQGLMNFVNAYRDLTLIPQPDFRIVSIFEIFRKIESLMENKLSELKINFSCSINPKTLEITADADLIEQVLINLVLNSSQALEGRDNGFIKMDAFLDENGKVAISVADNGPGISGEALKKVFIPFYTTKKNGSGIGLSLSRQIMRLHRGNIILDSEPDRQTTFKLIFS